MAPAPPNWHIECDYLESCNCDFGCSCNFSGFPNFGRCEALVGFHIRNGNYGHTRLDSLDFIYTASWPKAIHQGNGIMRVYVDQRASAEQRAGSGLSIPLDIDVGSCQRRAGSPYVPNCQGLEVRPASSWAAPQSRTAQWAA